MLRFLFRYSNSSEWSEHFLKQNEIVYKKLYQLKFKTIIYIFKNIFEVIDVQAHRLRIPN